ncbi:hypothetical protein BDV93DRAFT_548879 [Ceratobasidium sp. AG-I]|nr:hypothetical protein BDV93DRAFT_548879 [Ceratobasidium sp. AG-I]
MKSYHYYVEEITRMAGPTGGFHTQEILLKEFGSIMFKEVMNKLYLVHEELGHFCKDGKHGEAFKSFVEEVLRDFVFQQPPDSARSIAAHLHNATIVLQDKRKHAQLLKKAEHRTDNKGTNEIGLGVWFRESEDMDPFELANLPMVAEKFHKAIHLCSKVTNNGAMLSGTAYHFYVPPPRSRKDGTMEEWIKLQKESDLIWLFFNTQFEKFALAITMETHQAIKDLGVPVFGVCQTEPEVQGPSLGSDFSVSRNLVNKMHCDNDARKAAFQHA